MMRDQQLANALRGSVGDPFFTTEKLNVDKMEHSRFSGLTWLHTEGSLEILERLGGGYYGEELPIQETTWNEVGVSYRVILQGELAQQTGRIIRAVDESKSEVMMKLQASYEKLCGDHEHLRDSARVMSDQLQKLSEQNAAMTQLLSAKYSAKDLFLIAGACFLGFAGSFVLSSLHGVTLIHPIVAGVGIAGSAAFLFLSGWRYRQEQGREQ